jgi:hypothetical protein
VLLNRHQDSVLRLASASAAASYIMRRFERQDIKNEPFLGFRSGFSSQNGDLVGIGMGVGGRTFLLVSMIRKLVQCQLPS